ncbi:MULTISPECIES: hypothetical protein [unclassified Burkholderia]|uniref:hypothetical protein n=1 Tax=unclassified Burkholderia TaxID=2613784 RepID=UPI002AB0BBAE|nr:MULTISPECIES: hypothetical protein [unclassified Burkholderia]
MSAILKNRQSGPAAVFVNLNGKEGKFVHSEGTGDAKARMTFDQIDYAFVRKLSFREDEYKGEPIPKGQLHLEGVEDGSRVIVSFRLDTNMGARMIGLLNAAADKPDTPVRFNLTTTKEGEKLLNDEIASKDIHHLSARQEGAQATLKPKYDTPDGNLPRAKEVKLNGKTLYDRAEINDIVSGLFQKIVDKLKSPGETEGAVPAEPGDHVDLDDIPGEDEREPETEGAGAPRG